MINYLDNNLFKTSEVSLILVNVSYKFFYYNRIDLSERICPVNRNNTKECMVYHGWCFNHGFKYQDSVCIDCHDL